MLDSIKVSAEVQVSDTYMLSIAGYHGRPGRAVTQSFELSGLSSICWTQYKDPKVLIHSTKGEGIFSGETVQVRSQYGRRYYALPPRNTGAFTSWTMLGERPHALVHTVLALPPQLLYLDPTPTFFAPLFHRTTPRTGTFLPPLLDFVPRHRFLCPS
jgi:hypothetical protein